MNSLASCIYYYHYRSLNRFWLNCRDIRRGDGNNIWTPGKRQRSFKVIGEFTWRSQRTCFIDKGQGRRDFQSTIHGELSSGWIIVVYLFHFRILCYTYLSLLLFFCVCAIFRTMNLVGLHQFVVSLRYPVMERLNRSEQCQWMHFLKSFGKTTALNHPLRWRNRSHLSYPALLWSNSTQLNMGRRNQPFQFC